MLTCECEHIVHEPPEDAENLGCDSTGPLLGVRTDFGPFWLCEACRGAGHMTNVGIGV